MLIRSSRELVQTGPLSQAGCKIKQDLIKTIVLIELRNLIKVDYSSFCIAFIFLLNLFVVYSSGWEVDLTF